MGRHTMTNTQHFFRNDEGLCSAPLHYTDCGLDNVYILNGFVDDGESLTIKDMEGLHRAIGLNIALERKAPSGRELRFLREEMDMTQADLGRLLGVSSQSVARWEKGKTEFIGAAVFGVRVLYLMSLLPQEKVAEILNDFPAKLEALNDNDETGDKVEFSYQDHEWKDAA
jgi:DNA-binding transcriptional regulator YiaG